MLSSVLDKTIRFLSSYGFAAILLLLLLVLTFLGTLEQVNSGLYDVQKKYFESIFLVHHLFGVIPILLPGVYLLLLLLAVNLLMGGIIRMHRTWSRLGLFIAHGGILFLLLAGLVSFRYAVHGYVRLFEGEETSEFLSHHDWEIAVYRTGKRGGATEHLIPAVRDLLREVDVEARRIVVELIPGLVGGDGPGEG